MVMRVRSNISESYQKGGDRSGKPQALYKKWSDLCWDVCVLLKESCPFESGLECGILFTSERQGKCKRSSSC